MKRKSQIVLASAGLLLTGCATTQGSRTARAYATQARATPAGPVTTSASAPSMIGAGTSLVVSTNEAISTAQDIAGKTYAAEVTNDIVDQGGSMLVPKGSPVQLTVVASPTGGTAAAPDLQLALLSMTVNGKTYLVTSATADAGASSVSQDHRPTVTEKPLRGALLGTGLGSGTSGVVQAMTRGKELHLPTKTAITFRLEQTIQLVGYVP